MKTNGRAHALATAQATKLRISVQGTLTVQAGDDALTVRDVELTGEKGGPLGMLLGSLMENLERPLLTARN